MNSIPHTAQLQGMTGATAVGMRGTRPDPDPELVAEVADGTRGQRIRARNEADGWAPIADLQAEGCAYAVPVRAGLVFLDIDQPTGATDALLAILEPVAVVCDSGGVVNRPAPPGEDARPRLHVWIKAQPTAADLADLERVGGLDVRPGDGRAQGARMARPPTSPHRRGLRASTPWRSPGQALAILRGPDRTADLRAGVRAALAHGDAGTVDPDPSPFAGHRGERIDRGRATHSADTHSADTHSADVHSAGTHSAEVLPLPPDLAAEAQGTPRHRRRVAHRAIRALLAEGAAVEEVAASISATPLAGHYQRRAERNHTSADAELARHIADVLAKHERRPAADPAAAEALERMADAVAVWTWTRLPGRPLPATLHAVAVAVVGIARRAGAWQGVGLPVRSVAERAGVSIRTAARALDALEREGLVVLAGQAHGDRGAVFDLDPWHPAVQASHDTPRRPSDGIGPQHDAWRPDALGKAARKVWATLAALGGGPVSSTVVARHIGYADSSTARKHLRRLQAEGLAERGPDGWTLAADPAKALQTSARRHGTAGAGARARAEHDRQREGWRDLIADRRARQAEDRARWDAMRAHAGQTLPPGVAHPLPLGEVAPECGPGGPPPLPPPGPRPWDDVPPPGDDDAPDRAGLLAELIA